MDWVRAKALQRRKADQLAGCFPTVAGLLLGLTAVILLAAGFGWGSR